MSQDNVTFNMECQLLPDDQAPRGVKRWHCLGVFPQVHPTKNLWVVLPEAPTTSREFSDFSRASHCSS